MATFLRALELRKAVAIDSTLFPFTPTSGEAECTIEYVIDGEFDNCLLGADRYKYGGLWEHSGTIAKRKIEN
jgi:hypothetical protein